MPLANGVTNFITNSPGQKFTCPDFSLEKYKMIIKKIKMLLFITN